MPERLSIPEGGPDADPPYWKDPKDSAGSLWIKCPEGHLFRLDPDRHSVKPNGDVDGEVRCPNDDCDWQDHLHLEDYR